MAVAFALKYQQSVQSLILASGYYYPTVRADVLVLSGPSIPVLGDVAQAHLVADPRQTDVAAVAAKAFWPKPGAHKV